MWRHHALWLATATLILAAGLRLHQIAAQSIWFDEGWSAYAAGLPTLSQAASADLTNPPLYYVFLNAAARFFGTSELALRFVSLLLYLLTAALVFQLARRLFHRRAALNALLLIALSPLLGWAAQEARMYTLLALLIVIAALAWHQLLHAPTRWSWIALWAAELGLLYAHNSGPIAFVWLNAVTLLVWIMRRSLLRPDWRVWLAGQAAVIVLWMPWFSAYFLRLGAANSAVTSAPVVSAQLGFDLWQAYMVGIWSMINRELPLVVLSLIALLMYVLLVPWRQAAARWLVLHTLLLTIGIVGGLIVLENELHGRYLVMIAPLLLIPLGAGIARLHSAWLRLGVLAPFALMALLVGGYARQAQYQHDDVRTLVSHYADRLSAADTVLAWSYADRYDLAYYWARLGARARRVTLPEGADHDIVLPLLPTEGGVSRSIWYAQRADYRGMLPCLLGHGTVDLPETITVAGLSDEYYAQPGLWQENWRDTQIAFTVQTETVATLVRHGALPDIAPDRAVCVPLDLVLAQTTRTPLKAALIARNALGWEIARADVVFATADQRTSDQLPPGVHVSAYPLLRLPFGAPSERYQIFLRLYEEVIASGYEPRTDEPTSGRDVLLGTWNAVARPAWSLTNRAPDRIDAPIWSDGDLTLWEFERSPSAGALRNGDSLRLTLLWRGDRLPPLRLRDAVGGWSLESLPQVNPNADVTLEWREVRIPLDAASGTAQLELPDGTALTTIEIAAVPALYQEPAVERRSDADWPGVGRLVGFTLMTPVISRDILPEVELVWQAGEQTIDTDYTVFVQLIDEAGSVIAQSDAKPVGGARPLPGWRPGEYIVDLHRLSFHDVEPTGSVRLIAGLYDAATNTRLRLSDGQDSLTLIESVRLR